MNFNQTKENLKKIKGGFTLIEMVVVVGIFGILTAVIIFNYGDFNSHMILTNTAYETSLEIREAQVFSLGVRGGFGAEDFNTSYGVHFMSGVRSFVFFLDSDQNGMCNNDCESCNGNSDCIKGITLMRSITVGDLYISDEEVFDMENSRCVGDQVQKLSVSFNRPEPDALIYDYSMGSLRDNVNACIAIENSAGNQRFIIVRSTGQISVMQ